MKIRRISESFINRFSIVPPYSLSPYLDVDDLITLRRTHSFFVSGQLCRIASPIIHADSSITGLISFDALSRQFPKAKWLITLNGIIRIENSTRLTNITSLDLTNCFELDAPIPLMTNLTSLCLDKSQIIIKTEILNTLTKLLSLNLNNYSQIHGSTLKKLTSLRNLNLDNNTTITDLDIESLPIQSLSLVYNNTITPSIFKKLPLTQLNINCYPLLTEEILQCTTLTDLTLDRITLNSINEALLIKITNLKKLTINHLCTMLIDPLKYLTNLTYLELQSIIGDVEISSLRLLETLIIKGTSPRLNFPSTPLDNLSHLEISSYAYKLNFPFLKNLTTLDMGSGWLCGNRERIELKYLKKLILREVRYCSYIDISGLNFLTSLDILNCAVDTFVRQGALFANDTLQSLSVSSFYWNLDDSSLAGVPNLKYFYLDTFSYGGSKMNSSCFKDLENLFRLEGRKHNLSKECIASLKKKGIMIRYIP